MNKLTWLLVIVAVLGIGYYLTTIKAGPNSGGDEVITTTQVEEVAQRDMTFFISSTNPGTGANYGGLAGADQYCQTLASTAGAGDKTWRAYLSAVATENDAAVNARDRIGNGPWYNFNGDIVAATVGELHSTNGISKEAALTEAGDVVNGRGDTPNLHDILTGSLPDGTVSDAEGDTTCSNWTSEGEGSAIVGHHDKQGLDDTPPSLSWNSSHGSRGCSLENLNGTGGGGLLYCFAVAE